MLSLFEIAAVTRGVLADALELDFPDYDDSVLHAAGRHAGVTAIVTRDADGFAAARLRVYAPDELVRVVGALPDG